MAIYFDNAATTPLDPEVLDAMLPYLKDNYGNPSSIHAQGRAARAAIEVARKTIASLLQTSPSEIFFTSGGTEADNTAIVGCIDSLGIQHAITTPIEHHAVLHCMEALERTRKIKFSQLEIDSKGNFSLDHLIEILCKHPKSIVSIMHGNNELGNINDIACIGEICEQFGAIFHSDTVQTIGHCIHDLSKLKVDFIVGSAHKFHGPKGVGFLYINARNKIAPFINGGAQERNMRGGTENIYGIIGMAKALEIAYRDMEIHQRHIQSLKQRMISLLKENIPEIEFNGNADQLNSLHHILNISVPPSENNDMLLFNLDIYKISASGGSACSSGTDIGSHVLNHLKVDPNRGHIRFSFSKFNTFDEIDFVVGKLKTLVNPS